MAGVRVLLIGDLCLAGERHTRLGSPESAGIFAGLRDYLSEDDLLVANVECAISDRGLPVSGKWATLRAEPDSALSITRVNIANLGNNHISDYGDIAARHTRDLLEGLGVSTVGYGADLNSALKPCIVEKKGLRVGFVSFSCLTTNGRNYAALDSPGVVPLSTVLLRQSLDRVRPDVDALFVLLHWGLEGKRFPVIDQVRLGHRAIEWGANAVIGCHGHVIQPFESYGNGWIMYGLGNYLFPDVPYSYLRPDGTTEKGILRQSSENLESIAVEFSVTEATSQAAVRLERVLPLKMIKGFSPSVVGEDQLTVDLQAMVRRQRELVECCPDLWQGSQEIGYRTVVDLSGRFSHYYDPASPIDETVGARFDPTTRSRFTGVRRWLRAARQKCGI